MKKPTKTVQKISIKTVRDAPPEVEIAEPVIEAPVAEPVIEPIVSHETPEPVNETPVPWSHPRSDEAWTKCKDGVWWRPVDKFGGIEVKLADKPVVETTHEVLDQFLAGQISGF